MAHDSTLIRLLHGIWNWAKGAWYVLRGIKEFFVHPSLWLYAIIPFVCVKVVFFLISKFMLVVVFIPLVERFREYLLGVTGGNELIASLGEKAFFIILAVVLLVFCASVASALFEIFGSPFFAWMVKRYERMTYKDIPMDGPTVRQDVKNAFCCIAYSLGTVFYSLLVFAVGLLIPIVGQLLAIAFIGYRYGVSYSCEAGFNRGFTLKEFSTYFKSIHRMMMFGFGSTCFLILLVPFVAILLIPGLVIGGTIFVNEMLAKDSQAEINGAERMD